MRRATSLKLFGGAKFRLQCRRHESCEYVERSRKRCRGRLRANHARQRIRRPRAGTGRYKIAYSLVKLITRALKFLQAVAQRPRYGLLDFVGSPIHRLRP